MRNLICNLLFFVTARANHDWAYVVFDGSARSARECHDWARIETWPGEILIELAHFSFFSANSAFLGDARGRGSPLVVEGERALLPCFLTIHNRLVCLNGGWHSCI